MTLQDLFDQLAIGELAQIGLSNQGQGIELENQKKILAHVNLGLAELHTRFHLREKTKLVRKRVGFSKYIIDDPVFTKLEKVFFREKDKETGEYKNIELAIDQDGREDSVFTPTWNVLEIPDTLGEGDYLIKYRAKHDPLLKEWLDVLGADKIALPVPPTHVYPLELFIAAQLLTPMGFDGDMHEGNNYSMKFERACNELVNKGFRRQQETETHKFVNNGWV